MGGKTLLTLSFKIVGKITLVKQPAEFKLICSCLNVYTCYHDSL